MDGDGSDFMFDVSSSNSALISNVDDIIKDQIIKQYIPKEIKLKYLNKRIEYRFIGLDGNTYQTELEIDPYYAYEEHINSGDKGIALSDEDWNFLYPENYR